jgi:BirA family transcriptional regulator, biotin operon repressor / biotin---[acetyl-CoA-carboxylase] ligase|tara:strand:+ start:698 stop:1282 length:585 start_codon:yes stop_codon:yes gene_type:complete
MKFEIFKFEKVTSTNDIAINLIKKEQKESGCVYADIQTKGRGTYGREWISDKGNLFGSIFFPLKNNYPPFNEFSMINPLIISDVIKHFCEMKNINLKFPNDIFVNGKKICGILQELVVSNSRKFLIIGIGVNIVSNPDINNKYQATNILLETQKKPKIKEIIDLIVSSYEKFFINLNSYNYEHFKKKADSMALN